MSCRAKSENKENSGLLTEIGDYSIKGQRKYFLYMIKTLLPRNLCDFEAVFA